MTNPGEADRCAVPPPREHFRPIEPHGAFRVLLSARAPEPSRTRAPGEDRRADEASATERHDAIVGLARAVFAVGAELVVPADPDTVPLVASVALDYAPLPASERRERVASPLTVVETARLEPQLRAVLSPFMALDAVRYVDANGDPVEPDPEWARELEESEHLRHPVTVDLVERFAPRGAVLVSPGPEAEEEIDLLHELGMRVAVIAATTRDRSSADRWRHLDPTAELLRPERRGRWSEREGARDEERRPVVPYAYLMQRMIDAWAG